MSIFSGITNFLGGSLFKEVKDLVTSYFPPNMSPKERADAELRLQQFLHEKETQGYKVLNEASKRLDIRIKEQEGTAKDLLSMPILGRIVLFLRGVQRPLWGYATLYMDFKWFFGSYHFDDKQEIAMIFINILVLGFLFGERTIKNLSPLIMKVFGHTPSKSKEG